MRVLPGTVWLVAGAARGGLRAYVTNLARGLAAAGVETVLWTDAPGDWHELQPAGTIVRPLPEPWPATGGLAGPGRWLRSLHRLRELARREAPAVVHAHGLRAGVLASAACGGLVPVAATLHTYPEGWLARHLAAWVARRSDALVVVSDALARWARAQGLHPRRADRGGPQVLPPPLERRLAPPLTAQAARRALGLPQVGPVIGTVARLSPEKGIDVLLRAVALLRLRRQPLACAIIGDGPQRGALLRLAERLGVAGCVRWAGERAAAARFLRALDVYVQPSRQEALGLATLEAMAAARPVVVSRTGGLADLVRDGLDGRHVPPGDPEALARVLAELLLDRNQRERLARAAVARARRWPDTRALADGHLRLYRELAGETRPAAGAGQRPGFRA